MAFNLIIWEAGCRIYSWSKAQQERGGWVQPLEEGVLPSRSLWGSGVDSSSLGSGVAVEGRPEYMGDVAGSNFTIHTYSHSSTQSCN